MARGGPNRSGKLVPAGETLYLHYPWAGALDALDPNTLWVRETISDVYGLAYDGEETTYLVTTEGLTRLVPNAPPTVDVRPVPVERKYDDAPAAVAASTDRVYVLGYNRLDVFDTDLRPVATVELDDGQLRAMTLDAAQGRLYVGDYDGLYVLDAETLAFDKTPAPVLGVRAMALDPSGAVLYALGYQQPNWFQTYEVLAIDTQTWEVTALLQANNGRLSDLVYDQSKERLLVGSTLDHALIPIHLDTGEIKPRIPIGVEVEEVIVDAALGHLYVSESSGWVHVLDRETYAELGSVYGGRHIGLDASRGLLYAGDARLPEVTAFDTASLQVRSPLPQSGKPRPNPVTGEVVVVNRQFYVLDGESGKPRDTLLPGVGIPPEECPGCFYPIALDVVIDAGRGLTATTTYMPWPGKPGPQESIDYEPASGRAYYSLLTGGYVHYATIGIYPDLGRLQTYLRPGSRTGARGQPTHSLEGLSGYIRLDAEARRLYVTRGRFLFVLDSETLDRVGYVDAVDWSPRIAAVDSALGRLYTPREARLVVWTRTGGAPLPPLPHEPAVVTGTVRAIQASPNFAADQTLLATIDNQLCRSMDGGETWQRLRGGLPEMGTYPMAAVATFSPNYAQDGTVFYSASLGETHGEGVYRSTDGGETWHWSSDGLYDLRVYEHVFSPRYAQDGILLAYAHTKTGKAVYRSTDWGQHWQLVVRQIEHGKPPLPHPADLLGITAHAPQYRCNWESVCERSADGGRTWSPLDTGTFHTGRLVGYALSPQFDRDHTAYWIAENALYRYDDQAQRGEICTDPPLYGPRDYTKYLGGIATAATGTSTHVLFVGSNAGEFLGYAPQDLNWAQVWPAPTRPAPTPLPTPTPTPCAYAPDERFAIADDALLAPLGCAVAPGRESYFAYQQFELGMMFWHGEQHMIFVLQQDGTWAAHEDTWTGDLPDRDPALTPPEGLYQPVRGFGKLWREVLGGEEAWIGWAREEEQGLTAVIQPFAQGTALKGGNDVVYVLYGDGTWRSAVP
jgi:DNA-binding beta-propeller fold protein YncE